jgi:DNA-binding MurR/RpiR family transcriptional regulator
MDALSPAERHVGRALLADYPSAGLHTVAGLAERAGVSGPSVLRFAKRLGFASFPAMQDHLRVELSMRGGGPAERLVDLDHDSAAELVQSSVAVMLEATKASIDVIPQHELDATAELLADAGRSVYVAGGRYSALVAERFAELLAWIRPRVTMLRDPWHRDRGQLLDIKRRDVCIILDIRRYQRDAEDFAAHAKQRGASVIVLTDEWLSPAAHHADVVLAVSGQSASPFESLAGMLMLLEAMIVPVAAKLGPDARARMKAWESLEHDRKVDSEP